jgi:hypothetical protein
MPSIQHVLVHTGTKLCLHLKRFTFVPYPNLAQSSTTLLGDTFARTICHIKLILRAVIVF